MGLTAAAAMLAVLVAPAAPAHSSEQDDGRRRQAVPAELKAFIHKGESLISHQLADLNGDGRKDVLFVVEQGEQEKARQESGLEGPRSIRIAVRSADGSLALRASSNKAVLCRGCGGMMGDPFVDISILKNGFEIHHYGGSSWRWLADYRFAYSRRDDAWQLVAVREQSFHASVPDKPTIRTYRPPKDFGKIDFTAFDPERFKGQGEK